jgi:hypothetical protein
MKALITETQFKKLRKFLTEITIEKAYTDIYSKFIPKEEFEKIIKADTFNKPNVLSYYSKWILDLYKNKNFKLEDLSKAIKYIDTFDKVKSRLPIEKRNISNFKTLADMFVVVQPYLESGEEIKSNTSLEKEIKQKETKRLYEDSNWLVVQPLSERAACFYGKNTEWCTAAKEDNRFDYYDKQGKNPLYINIDKINNRKYQFHFESNQFMDENDSEIDLFEFLDDNPSLKTFYTNFLKDKLKGIKFNDLIINDSGCYIFVNRWKDFSPAFEVGRNKRNPAIILDSLDYEVFNFDFYLNNYFYMINSSNLEFMTEFLIKNGNITEDADYEEIMEKILDDPEFSIAIDNALIYAKDNVVKEAIKDDILDEIKKHFNIRDIEYKDNGILLKMVTCPDPIKLFISSPDFIIGYNTFGQIDFNYDYDYYYDKEPDRKLFNQYLSDNLNDL